MKVTFNGGVLDKGTLYEAGQTYDLSDADVKRFQESLGQDIVVPAAADAQVTKQAEAEKAPARPAPAPTTEGNKE
jgi:queuine/archaeosine tRNA-ribosyltransferase